MRVHYPQRIGVSLGTIEELEGPPLQRSFHAGRPVRDPHTLLALRRFR